jgi:hypothetical protein
MRRLFTLFAAICCAVASFATDYTDSLEINLSGGTLTTPATISVNEASDGTLDFTLKNFMLTMGGQTMAIGNITLSDVPTADGSNVRTIFYKHDTIKITEGDDSSVTYWVGPGLGDVEIDLAGYKLGSRVYAYMNIKAGDLKIICKFGRGFQFQNNGFENYHTATVSSSNGSSSASSDEPDHWHSFMSASGSSSLVYLAGRTPHTFISDSIRPGSTGNHSLLITSSKILFVIANGTVTTGRLNAGSYSAADVANHSWLDLDSTDVDANGDPFYQYMNGRPDSLVVWVKFKQATPNAQHPYATVSAAITDGTYFQMPDTLQYTNILALARNSTIATNGNVWQRLSIPFDYDSYVGNNATGRAVLTTISTNADAGQGSTDTLYVDDIELVYNNALKSVTYNGTKQEITDEANASVTFEGNNATVSMGDITFETAPHSVVFPVSEVKSGSDVVLTYYIFADDLSSSIPVTVTVTNATSGINGVIGTTTNSQEAIYNINGQRVSTMQPGQVYIVKYADGTTKKVLK